ncbi:MAG: oligosaccharide flippase family protein [Candidatus Levybacteria bacterium]|nr:oligosaccharide flippase family protein [Candidatus Levybacteria bacterium]
MNNEATIGYFKKSVIGVFWTGLFRIASRGVVFLKIIILARLLTPAQFGVFGIASIALAFLEVITETGINVFFIQQKKNIEFYVNEAWLISIIRGFLICFIIIISSPLVAGFFNSPDAYILLLLIGAVPLIRGFINPSIIKYQKELEFNKEFIFRLTIFVFDTLVGVLAVFLTRSPIGIVIGLITGAILEVVLSFIFLRPIPEFSFDLSKVREIIRKGKWVTMYVIFHFITKEGDKVVVGKILGIGLLGIYQIGYNLSTLPISEISDVANKVIFPVYTKIVHDKERLFRAFRKTLSIIFVIAVLLGSLLFILPKEIFTFVLGEQWAQVNLVIKILAVYGVIRAIVGIPSTLFLSLGKQNYVAFMTFFRFLILFITIVPFTNSWGIEGAGYSALTSAIAELPLIGYYLIRIGNKNKL